MLKIIIVEDEDYIRKGLVYTIDWLSMNCVVIADASDGEEGLRKIIELKPDVVITDIKMPKMDGIEMIKRAREQVKFSNIILTSYMEFDYAMEAIQLKSFDYLVKPVDEDKICKLIQKLEKEIESKREEDIIIENSKNSYYQIDLNGFMGVDSNIYVKQALQEIKTNYAQKLSVESISEKLGVSASYLSRKVKDETNQTFLELLNKFRVQQAVKLLCTGKYRVYEISEMVGFTDYKHFCAVFKKYALTSPTSFVKTFINP